MSAQPLTSPAPALVAKSAASLCHGTMLHCWHLATEPHGEQHLDEWMECTHCRQRFGMDENPEHSAPVEVAAPSLPEGEGCPF